MKELVCIGCPRGCQLKIEKNNRDEWVVTGNTCKRGETYARQECVDPQRMVTAVIPVEGSAMPLSVKTRTPIPKKLIRACMAELAAVRLSAPVAAGSVVLPDVCGTGVDIIATKSVGA